MKFHEKSLELNITHELLNLADSWSWFLMDIPLWRYWRPRHRLPFLKFPKSTSGGFHITTEGKSDPTGEAGGGYDVRIKTGLGGHLLFIQYKMGTLIETSPDPKSEFENTPHDHFEFEINGTTTDQHFVLRELAKGIGSGKGNAVVYALPLIADMDELEKNAGQLVRKTKFVSIADIDLQAKLNKVSFTKGKAHNFRVGKYDMARCEVNYFYFFFGARDRAAEIITDIIALRFQQTLFYFLQAIRENYRNYDLYEDYIPFGLQQSFIQYLRYLMHYFEVSPSSLNISFLSDYTNYFLRDEFSNYEGSTRDVEIITSVFNGLSIFVDFINGFQLDAPVSKTAIELPRYQPQFLISAEEIPDLRFDQDNSRQILEDVTYLII